jgi:steroid delta-isomerase-like uncharacterized protein
MAPEDIKAIARRGYEAMNTACSTGNFDLLDGFIAADIVDHNPAPEQGPGVEGVKQLFAMFRAAFPDLRIVVEDLIAEGDKVTARIVMRGTHTGDFMGIPATGKPMAIEAIDILRIQGGKCVEHWGQYDQMGMMQQLGISPPPG